METIEITRKELKKILIHYGNHCNVTIPIRVDEQKQSIDVFGDWQEFKWVTILNNGIVYNPESSKQIESSTKISNANKVLKFIDKEVKIDSNSVLNISAIYKLKD